MRHELKILTEYFNAVAGRQKNFEARKDDRGFEVGDTLVLKEYDNVAFRFTGREVERRVTYILRGPDYGVQAGHVVMSIKPIE